MDGRRERKTGDKGSDVPERNKRQEVEEKNDGSRTGGPSHKNKKTENAHIRDYLLNDIPRV